MQVYINSLPSTSFPRCLHSSNNMVTEAVCNCTHLTTPVRMKPNCLKSKVILAGNCNWYFTLPECTTHIGRVHFTYNIKWHAQCNFSHTASTKLPNRLDGTITCDWLENCKKNYLTNVGMSDWLGQKETSNGQL